MWPCSLLSKCSSCSLDLKIHINAKTKVLTHIFPGTTAASVCSYSKPFILGVSFDGSEVSNKSTPYWYKSFINNNIQGRLVPTGRGERGILHLLQASGLLGKPSSLFLFLTRIIIWVIKLCWSIKYHIHELSKHLGIWDRINLELGILISLKSPQRWWGNWR